MGFLGERSVEGEEEAAHQEIEKFYLEGGGLGLVDGGLGVEEGFEEVGVRTAGICELGAQAMRVFV